MLSAGTSALDERIELLRRPGLWADLPEATLRDIAAALQPAMFASGQAIIVQGERGRHLHILTSGLVEVRVKSEGGAVVPVASFRAGDSFGEMSLLTGEVTSADVVAVEDSETLVLERATFDALTVAHPGMLRDFVRVISRRLRETDSVVGVARDRTDDVARMLNESKAEAYGELIGNHRDIHDLRKQIELLAEGDEPILIEGEAGTGKELAARRIHFRSRRKDAPFLSIHAKQVLESRTGDSLFGEPGAREGPSRALSYLQIARGGTVLIKNVEDLSPGVQERLAETCADGAAFRDVRIMVTCRTELSELAETGRMSSVLAAILARRVVRISPLRDRKRDIPALANHFAHRHATRLGKEIAGLDDQAMVKLVSYDFLIGNVRELEEAVERAVVLTEDATIDAEEVFLGPPPLPRAGGFNILPLVAPVLALGPRVFPGAVTAAIAVVTAYVMYMSFFGAVGARGNIATTLVWSLGWPALVLSFFFVGRVCCAVCPMALAGRWAQRWKREEGRIPGWVKKYDSWIVIAGFFVILWAEEVTLMRTSPRATGVLLLTILVCAVATAALYPRRTWCRHLCPLGGLAGVCSASSMLELRPSLDICEAKCKDHSCYKGGGGIPGCPMFNHVMFVESNQQCVFCLNCVRTCPSGSPQLNVRMPARELWTNVTARPEVGRFIAMLSGLVVAAMLVQAWEKESDGAIAHLLARDRTALVSGLYLLCAGLPLLALALASRRAARRGADVSSVWQRVSAWVPLVGAGFTAYHVAYLPGMDTFRATLTYRLGETPLAVSFSAAAVAQCFITAAGLAITMFTIWRDREGGEDGQPVPWKGRVGRMAGALGYCAMLLAMIVRPSWLPW